MGQRAKCPNCGRYACQWGEPEMKSLIIDVPVYCGHCQAEWIEEYRYHDSIVTTEGSA